MSAGQSAALVALLALTCVQPAAAQLTVGAKGGLATSSFTGSSLERLEWTRGATAGVFVTTVLAQELSFQSELMYVHKGAGVVLGGTGAQMSGTLHLDYVELPAMLRIDLPLMRRVGVHVMGGPTLALNVRCSFEDDEGDDGPCIGTAGVLAVHTFDAGLLAGAGLNVAVGGAVLTIEGRYGFGLMNVDAGTDFSRTNEVISFVAGVSVPLAHSRAQFGPSARRSGSSRP